MIPHKDDYQGWVEWNRQKTIRSTKGSLQERLLRLHSLLEGRTPTLGEFALATGYKVFWDSDFLAAAILDARRVGVVLPEQWTNLSEVVLLYTSTQQRTSDLDVQKLKQVIEIVRCAISSTDPVLLWSGFSVIVKVLHRLGGSLGRSAAKDPQVKALLTELFEAIPVVTPPLLVGAEFEAGLIWIGLSSFRLRLLWAVGGQYVDLETTLKESKAARDMLALFENGWRPGRSVNLGPFITAKTGCFNKLTSPTAGPPMPHRVLLSEPNLVPYLNLISDVAFHHSKRLSLAAHYSHSADRISRGSALILAAGWAVTAWETQRAKRRWCEVRSEARKIPTSGYRIHQDEVDALLLAVTSLQVAGSEPWAAALASLATSYGDINGVVTGREADLESPYSIARKLMSVRQEFGWLIRQLGFQLLGGADGESEPRIAEARSRQLSPQHRSLFEVVSHAAHEETECWEQIEQAIGAIPKLTTFIGKPISRPQLLRTLYQAIVRDESSDLGDDFESAISALVRPVFRIAIMRWHLRWAARLLTIEGTALSSEDLQTFLSAWQFTRGLAPELIGPQVEFQQRAKAAFARLSDELDDKDYYFALETINSPVLTMPGFDAGKIFERWVNKDIHALAMGSDVDRRRLGLTLDFGRNGHACTGVTEASIEALQSRLAKHEKCVWINFIVGGRPERPEIIGMTLDGNKNIRRWRQELDPDNDPIKEAARYVQNDLDKSIRRFARPPRLFRRPFLKRLVDTLRKESSGADRVFLNCPPELNSLPWRWLIQAETAKDHHVGQAVFVVPSASWFIRHSNKRSNGKLAIRPGHGKLIEISDEFTAAAVVETSESTVSLDEAVEDLSELREVCRRHSVVIDNRCFGGHSGRWRGSEWNGNPAMLLVTQCRLFVAPPCRIPVTTADKLADRLRGHARPIDTTAVIAELEVLSNADPAAWLYNLYGAP